MNTRTQVIDPLVRSETAVVGDNRVLRNTYALLSMTLLFSALTAGISMALNLPHPGLLLTLAREAWPGRARFCI